MVLPFSVSSEYTQPNVREMQRVIHRRTARLYFILSLVGIALMILGTIIGEGFCIYCGVFWWLFCMFMRHRPARKNAQATVKSHLKNYGKHVTTTVKFYSTMLTAQNETTGAQTRANYDEVEKLYVTANLYVLQLPDRVALMVDRTSLDANEDRELWELLRGKCTAAEVIA